MNSEILFGHSISDPKPNDVLDDTMAMKLAVQEGFKGLGFVSPNPLVGCVILSADNKFISKGYHAKYGEGHAEVQALRGVSESVLKGARVFVTLEPCAHEGKTPSCAKALAKLPIKEVIYGLIDPNPLVAGQGCQILNQAGIQTSQIKSAELVQACEQLAEHFLWNYKEKKTFVSVKVASSLDGLMALKTGESQWITGEASRKYAHELRAYHDATMIGVGTLKQDNAKLNIRHEKFPQKKNTVVIVDSQAWALQNSNSLNLFSAHAAEDLIFMVGQDAKLPAGLKSQVLRLPSLRSGLDLGPGLDALWGLGVKSVFVEGGAKLISSLIFERRVQRLYLFQAPIILGASSGRSWSEQVKIQSMSDKITLKNQIVKSFENDVLFTGRF